MSSKLPIVYFNDGDLIIEYESGSVYLCKELVDYIFALKADEENKGK